VIGTRAMLIPALNAMRSMLSSPSVPNGIGTLVGKRALMKAYPGRYSTKKDPSC
jgi:hypothetical protein